MKTRHTAYPLYIIILIMLCVVTSCKKTAEGNLHIGGATAIKINLVSSEEDKTKINFNNEAKSNNSAIESNSLGIISFSKNKMVEVTLEPENFSTQQTQQTKSSSSKDKKAEIIRKKIASNILYRLLVYNAAGNFVTERDYLSGSEEKTEDLALDRGDTYTFIAVSMNNDKDLPIIENKNTLKDAEIINATKQFMFYKSKVTLSEATYDLNIILKHQLGQLSVDLSIDAGTEGTITNLTNTSIKPSSSSASLKLETGNITYQSQNSNGAAINFPTLAIPGVRSVMSSQTLVFNPETNSGTLTFGRITIDGETKENLTISNIKIKPGVAYQLHLNFRTCTAEFPWEKEINWNYEEKRVNGVKGISMNNVFVPDNTTISETVRAPKASYGVVIDFTLMDNSFNMELNGVSLCNQEIQFQDNTYTPPNIMYEDGSYYEGINTENNGRLYSISALWGRKGNPLLRLVISRHGDVMIYGCKEIYGKLYPLKLYNGAKFNKFPWNKDSENVIKFTQRVDGRTRIQAYGVSRNKVLCNP